MAQLTGDPGEGWTHIECASMKAYGCGNHGQEAVEGLALYARLGGDCALLTSSLAVRMSDEALRTFISDWRRGAPSEESRRMYAHGRVLMAEHDLIVLLLSLQRGWGYDGDCHVYYLVYDDADASLSMVSYLPDSHGPTCCSSQPVPKRAAGGACELLLMAEADVLCVLSPEAANDPAAWSCPWRIKGRRFPAGKIREPFVADSVFSFQGMGFWADLAQGVVYCDLHAATTGGVDFGFIELPPGCQLDHLAQTLVQRDCRPKNVTRTMGCVNDSIWFACIDRATKYRARDLDSVTMWSLKLPEGQWNKEAQISAREIWGLDGFKEAGLPEEQLDFPTLTADGALCLVLNEPRPSFLLGHVCGIDRV